MYNIKQSAVLSILFSYAILIFVSLNIVLWVTTIYFPGFLSVPKQFFGVDFVKENFGRAQGAISYYRNNSINDHDSLVVILGLSGASEGLKIDQLQKNIGNKFRLLSLCGAGRNIDEISLYAKPLLKSSLKPRLVIFAISPFHLLDPLEDNRNPWSFFEEISIRHLLTGWFSAKRNDIRHLIDMKIMALRVDLFNVFGGKLFDGDQSPWRDNIRMGIHQLSTTRQWNSKLEEYGNRGYYNLEHYENTAFQISQFAKLIKIFRSKGTEVRVVLMPEHSSLNHMIPAQAMKELLEKLNGHLLPSQIPLIENYRQSIADEGFNDISHLNEVGRKSFTPIFSKFLLQGLTER